MRIIASVGPIEARSRRNPAEYLVPGELTL